MGKILFACAIAGAAVAGSTLMWWAHGRFGHGGVKCAGTTTTDNIGIVYLQRVVIINRTLVVMSPSPRSPAVHVSEVAKEEMLVEDPAAVAGDNALMEEVYESAPAAVTVVVEVPAAAPAGDDDLTEAPVIMVEAPVAAAQAGIDEIAEVVEPAVTEPAAASAAGSSSGTDALIFPLSIQFLRENNLCYNCFGKGHPSAVCRNRNPRCINCGKYGHRAVKCHRA